MAKVLEAPHGTREKKPLISFRYEALTDQGSLVKGTIKASGEIEAERLLIGMNYRPVHVELVPSMFSLEEAFPGFFGVKPRDVIVFSRQLATLLKSGISLLPALDILSGQAVASRAFKKVMESMIVDLRGGSSFSQSLVKHPRVFSEIYCRTLAVGEQSGNLEMVLKRMADYQEKQGAVSKKIGAALSYPMIILVVGLVVGVIMMTVVMPKMLTLFTTMNAVLPLPTRILIGTTNFMTKNVLGIIIFGAVLAVAIIWMMKQPSGRRFLDRMKLQAPLIGPPTLMSELARFCRSASVLIAAGLSLQEIMEVVPQSSNNSHIRSSLNELKERLLLGEGLSEPMSRISLFPPLLVQMVAVGEESNTLDFTLGVVADFYEETAEEKTTAMTGMIGPLATIVIALFVGFIAVSVLMPMYSITGAFE